MSRNLSNCVGNIKINQLFGKRIDTITEKESHMEFKTWLEYIENQGFDESTQHNLIQEAPHTRFGKNLPSSLSFLNGSWVDMGFENLGLDPEKYKALYRAFSGTGVMIPGTNLKLRHAAPGQSGVETQDGTEEISLPDNWKQAIFVMDNDDRFTWVGKLVRPIQVNIDKSKYREEPDGWVLKELN